MNPKKIDFSASTSISVIFVLIFSNRQLIKRYQLLISNCRKNGKLEIYVIFFYFQKILVIRHNLYLIMLFNILSIHGNS